MFKSLILASMLTPFALNASVEVGKAAPNFSVTDAQGKTRSLAEFKGKTVVLEWNNPECPFVKKHYNASTNMQTQQEAATGADVVWLSINSGAPGKQGALDGAAAIAKIAALQAAPSAYLLDPDGKVGQAYGAKTTPHMYVIDGSGVLRYAGAIDSIPSADASDIPAATQYVSQALAELKAGKPVSMAVTKPYGCSVKY
jgi:peroxiredoxin